MAGKRIRYGQWTIEFDPPPIPVRDSDWNFAHDDYDASYEGEEDGYVDNGLGGRASSIADAKAQIADIEADNGMPSTAEAVARAKAEAMLPAVVNFSRCAAPVHDGSARGCCCGEIARRLVARAAIAQAEAA